MDSLDESVIELGEGFSSDDVTVTVDRQVIWRGRQVTTDYSIGVAEIIRVPRPIASSLVAFQVGPPNRVRTAAIVLAADVDRIRCSVDPDGTLIIVPAREGPIF